jgi:hypothetical protein
MCIETWNCGKALAAITKGAHGGLAELTWLDFCKAMGFLCSDFIAITRQAAKGGN